MKILAVHNRYQQAGGEDEVFRAETQLLRRAGHDVVEYTRGNDEIGSSGLLSRAALPLTTVWSRTSAGALRELLRRERFDIAHFHNTLPLISPAAYYACHDAGVPVVQTLHNYRLLCPAATQFRDGSVCEECSETSLLQSVRHACYRGSRSATAVVAAMLTVHRALETWRDRVDVYIALSEFARDRFIAGGLPADKVLVKANFVDPDPGPRDQPGEGALFVGRLSPEKGAGTVLDAWCRIPAPMRLDLIGDGPERTGLQARSASNDSVRFHGRRPRQATIQAMKQAQFLVFPSEWYEGLPMTIVEAFACGLPVIASRLGTMAEVVADGRTGLHFTPGDAADLAAKVTWARRHPGEMAEMGRAARRTFETAYTAPRNLEVLISVYERAVDNRRAAASQRGHRTHPDVRVMDDATAEGPS